MGHGSHIAPILHLDLGVIVFHAKWLLQKLYTSRTDSDLTILLKVLEWHYNGFFLSNFQYKFKASCMGKKCYMQDRS
jgi:hypothetical protein